MGGVESPSEDDEAVVDADEKKEVSEEEEADAGDKPANDATADDETEDEIITTVASDEDDLNKFDAVSNEPNALQIVGVAPLKISDKESYTGVSISQEVRTPVEKPAKIDITFEADKDIPANTADDSQSLGYYVGISLPSYEGWGLTFENGGSHIVTNGNNVYYKITGPGIHNENITAKYSKDGEERKFTYYLDASACHAEAALLVPSSSYAQGLKASTTSVSEGQVAENFKIDATVDEPVETTPFVISMNAVVDAGAITQSKDKGDNPGYWVSLAVPTTKEGVTAKYAINDEYPILETPAAVDTEVVIGSNTYKTISVNMADYDDKTAYLVAEYTVNKAGWSNTVKYLYKITFDYTKNNGIPSAPEAAIHVLKDAPKGEDQNPGYTVSSSVSGNGTTVVDVNATSPVKPYTVSGPDAGGNGYWVGIAFPGYGTGVSENEALSDTIKYKAGATSDSLSEVTLKKSAKKGANAYKVGDNFYDLFYVDLNTLANKVEYVDVTYTSASTGETKTYHYLFDFSDIQLYTGLPTIDQMVQGVEEAPLSASATEAADRAKNYEVSTPKVSGNEITVKVTADDVVKGKVSGNDTPAYYVGVTIPALATEDADFKAEYGANTTGLADYSNKLNAAISSNGVLKTATGNAGKEGTDTTKDLVKQRVAYFDVATTAGKKGYVYVKYTNNKIDSKTVEYKYIVDFSDVTMSNSLPRIDDVKKITFVNSKNNPEGETVDAGFTAPDVSVTGVNELTISANNTKAFRYFTVSSDDAPSSVTGNGYWVAAAIPMFGTGVSANTALDATAYKLDGSDATKDTNYKEKIKIGDNYYDVFYLNAAKDSYTIEAEYKNKDAEKISYTYVIDLSKVLYDDDLPDNVEASFIPLKDSKGAVVDPGYSTKADSRNPLTTFKTVSVNNANAMAPYIISGNAAGSDNYWVGMAFPGYGTGVSSNDLIKSVAYKKASTSANFATVATSVEPDVKVPNFKGEDNKYYDVFYLNLSEGTDYFFAVEYTNLLNKKVTYQYEFDFSKFTKDNGIPALEEVSKVGDYIQIADPVAKNIITEPYAIGDVDIDEDADPKTITVSVNAAGLRVASYADVKYDDVSKKQLEQRAFWAGIKVKSLSANASKDLPYDVKYSFDGTNYFSNGNVSSNWIEKNFNIDDSLPAYIYVKYINRAVNTDYVIYKYVLNFTGITKDMKPAGIVEAVTTVALNDKNDDDNPYSANTVTASADTQKDSVITVPVKVSTSNLKYHVEKDNDSSGYGYWTGIALPQSLEGAAQTVTWHKGLGEFDLANPGSVSSKEGDFKSNKDGVPYGNFVFDAEEVKNDYNGKAYVVLDLAEGSNHTYVVYDLDFSGVTLKNPTISVDTSVSTDDQVLFEKSSASNKARTVTFAVTANGDKLAYTNVKYEILDKSGIAATGVAKKIRDKTNANGEITIPLTLSSNVASAGVVTVNLTVGDNAGGASYSIEVYEEKTPTNSIKLDLTDEKEGILNPTFILAADSQFATSYAIKSGDADAIKLDTSTGEITALDKTTAPVVVSQNIVDKNGNPVNEEGKNTGSYITTDSIGKNYNIEVGASYSSAEIEIVDDNFYVNKESAGALKLNFTPGKYTPDSPHYSWQSTNNAIAIIQSGASDPSPVIKGVKAGTVTITCTYSDGGKTVTVKKQITVKEPLGAWTLYYNGTKATKDTDTFKVTELNKNIKLVAKLDAGSKKVIPATWTSSDKGVVSFGTDATSGIMEAVAVGTATVTATAADGTVHTIKVIVTDDDSVEVGVSPTAVALKKAGDTTLITPTLTRSKDVKTSISADSANTSVATVSVSSNGQVIVKAETAKKSSTTVNVYYKGSDSKNHNYATVNVTTGSDPVKATGIKADVTNASIYIDDKYSFAYTVTPANYTDAVLKWSSANTDIATVDPTSGEITGKAKGEATILLVIENSDESKIAKEFTVNVKAVPAPEAIAISPKSLTLTAPAGNNSYGGTAQLTAKVSPADADQKIVWSSANKKVAEVDKKTGLVKATGVGTTTIKASTDEPYYYGETITVTVIKTVDSSDDAYYANAFDSESGEPQAWMGTLKDEDGNTSFTYTGAAIKPVPNVYYGDMPLVAGTDFTYSYKNNINAAMTKNKPTVTVRLKGNYSGTLTREFEIQPRDIAEATANNVSAVEKFNKKTGAATEQLLKPVITFNGKTLRENKDGNADYKLYYLDDDETAYAKAGTYPVTIYGTGNYTGQTTVDEVIIPAANANNLSKAKIAFTFDEDNQVLNSKGVAEAKKAYYDGGEIVPGVTVTYGGTAKVAGVTLTEGTDYTMTVTNNVNLGKATVTITGIGGGYYGTKKDTFTIVPKVTALNESTDDKLVITVNDVDTTVNSKPVGKKIVAEATNNKIHVPFLKGGVKPAVVVKYGGKELKLGTDYTVTYKGGKNKGTVPTKNAGGSVVINGKGKFFKGSATLNYDIIAGDITEMTYVVDDYVATAKTLANYAKKVSLKAYDLDGKALVLKKDYVITSVDQLSSPAIGDVVNVTIQGVGNYAGETKVSYRIVDNVTIKTLKGAKYAFFDDDNYEVKSNKFYVKYAGTPVVLTKDDLIIRVNKKIGRTTQLETLENGDYEILLYENNNKVGTSKITIKGVGDYAGVFTLSYRITNR